MKSMRTEYFLLAFMAFLTLYHLSEGRQRSPKGEEKSAREGKVFSLFNIVQFKNDPCTTSGGSAGTCYTSSECIRFGGRAQGNCAAGFGVCCLFIVEASDSTIARNSTIIRNPGHPAPYADTAAVSYTINKCSSDICYLRLDFDTFTVLGMTDSLETATACPADTFAVTTSSGANIPVICGQNNGQHMYVDIGNNPADSATLDFTFNGASNNRMWDIRVSQIPCGSVLAPPDGCLQYHTGLSGRITTFNFDATEESHLPNQDYSICVRRESGFCCVLYNVCPDDTLAYSLSAGDSAVANLALQDSCTTTDYLTIADSGPTCNPGAANAALDSRYCGGALGNLNNVIIDPDASVCDCTAPFSVDIFTNAISDRGAGNDNDAPSKGVCLDYQQVAC